MIEEVIMPPKSHKSEEEGIDTGIINSVLLRIGVTGTRSRDNINALFSTTVYCSVVYIYIYISHHTRSRRRNLIARNAFVSLAVINIKGYTLS